MSKKLRVSPVADFQINTDIITGDLPALDTVNKTVAELTGKKVASTSPTPPTIKGVKSNESKPIKEKKTVAKPTEVKTPKPIASKAKPEIIAEIKMQLKYGRPQKEIAAGRTKFTTMLQPEMVKQLKRKAIDEGITVADLLETLLVEYFLKKS
jgi:lipoprotein-anchoring transpeptidase ErfK/SrfK